MTNKYFMYIGTFTHQFKNGDGTPMGAPADGIGIFEYDASDASMKFIETVPDLLAPSWVTFHPTLPVLYGIERKLDVNQDKPGALASYTIDEATGKLTQTSRESTVGTSPPFVSVHPSGGHAYGVHFVSGHVVAFPLDEEGRVLPVDASIQHKIEKPVPEGLHHHLYSVHPHKILPAPNGRYVTVSDVGLNAIVTYPTDPADGTMTTTPSFTLEMPDYMGPRHHDRHPSNKFVFACGEVNDALIVMALNDETGELSFLSSHSSVPEDYVPGPDHVGTAECLCHPNGKAVYVSNRGHDSIAVYSFDESTGEAKFLGTQSACGVTPRAFSVDPTGQFLIVANQTPGSLVPFRIDQETGWIEREGDIVETPTPVCIIFRPQAG